MGYDTYNAFEKDFDGALTIEQGRLMKEYGLVDAGYNVGDLISRVRNMLISNLRPSSWMISMPCRSDL